LTKLKSKVARRLNKPDSEKSLRQQIAARYLTGEGIEIGALHSPLIVSSSAKVRYVDRMTVSQLREQYPELSACQLVNIDIIDDGETLESIPDSSLDFAIANHVIEHCENTIFSLKNWLRVLKSGGILYMALPDKRYTFDRERSVTPLQHIIRDYDEGSKWSRKSHFEEWSRLIDKVPEDRVALHAERLAEKNYSIHFHVWTQIEFLELLMYCRNQLNFPFEIELSQKNMCEFITILSKTN
jgi:SAM-dependent methyltransferase